MKKLSALLATLLLSSAISVSAYAADKNITVMIDEQPVTFSNSAPIQENGTVSVPFRVLFEELGLQVNWDSKTKTITGAKSGLEIQMKIGSKQATVNGQVKTLTVAPKTMNNVTYVPLRFISEVTGNDVQWDSKTQSVLITTTASDSLEADVQAVLDELIQHTNEENLDGIMNLFHPSSPFADMEDLFKEQLDTYDIEQSIDEIYIVSSEPNEIIVQTIEITEKIDGPFMLDYTAEVIYSMIKDDGDTSWKLYNLQVADIAYYLPEDALTAEVQVPQVEKDQILKVLNDNVKFTNEENLAGVINTIGGSDDLIQMTEEVYEQLFDIYDLNNTIDNTKIIYYADGEAAVYTEQTTKKVKGPEFQDNVTEVVHTLQKDTDGAWKIVTSSILNAEPLDS